MRHISPHKFLITSRTLKCISHPKGSDTFCDGERYSGIQVHRTRYVTDDTHAHAAAYVSRGESSAHGNLPRARTPLGRVFRLNSCPLNHVSTLKSMHICLPISRASRLRADLTRVEIPGPLKDESLLRHRPMEMASPG